MDFESFLKYVEENEKPENASVELDALRIEKNGDWDEAHRIVQALGTREAAWIHAYLHRKEGDYGNASYWYNRAEKERPDISFDEEWEKIARALIEK